MTLAIISSMAVGFCFVPFILLGWKKMRRVNAYCLIGIYWLLNGLINLPAPLPFTGDQHSFGRLNNYFMLAETPLVIYSIAGLGRYVKKMEHTRFETSMVFVYAALLFAYGSFFIIYIFAHWHPDIGSSGIADSYLLYYISLLLSAAVTSTGLWTYGLRRAPAHIQDQHAQQDYSSSSS